MKRNVIYAFSIFHRIWWKPHPGLFGRYAASIESFSFDRFGTQCSIRPTTYIVHRCISDRIQWHLAINARACLDRMWNVNIVHGTGCDVIICICDFPWSFSVPCSYRNAAHAPSISPLLSVRAFCNSDSQFVQHHKETRGERDECERKKNQQILSILLKN